MAILVKVILGSISFVIFWVLAVSPSVPFLPIGRTAGSLLGAMLMVIFQVITADEAYEAIDLPILGLLFGTMVLSTYLEKADAFNAFFTNDTSGMVLTEFVLKIARQHNLPPHPFLLALASSANIGSSATLIGNPQNLVIAAQSNISFGDFLLGMLPAAIVGVFVNPFIILCMYWSLLCGHKNEEDTIGDEVAAEDDVRSHQFLPATMPQFNNGNTHDSLTAAVNSSYVVTPRSLFRLSESERPGVIPNGALESTRTTTSLRWKMIFWKSCVYLITIGMLISLLMGENMSWTSITAALALMVLDFKDAQPCLETLAEPACDQGGHVPTLNFEKNTLPRYLSF
ncbi:silicon efflux transporter LSI2-like [Fagus crenata]